MYMPQIRNARRVGTYQMGFKHFAVLLTDCESVGMIEYQHALLVYEVIPLPEGLPQKARLVLAVATEINTMLKEMPNWDGRRFLGVFPGNGHINMGMSLEVNDLDVFTAQALEVASERLEIEAPPLLLEKEKDPGWQGWRAN